MKKKKKKKKNALSLYKLKHYLGKNVTDEWQQGIKCPFFTSTSNKILPRCRIKCSNFHYMHSANSVKLWYQTLLDMLHSDSMLLSKHDVLSTSFWLHVLSVCLWASEERIIRWSVCAGAVWLQMWHRVARGDGEVSEEGEALWELAALERRCRPHETTSCQKALAHTAEKWTARQVNAIQIQTSRTRSVCRSVQLKFRKLTCARKTTNIHRCNGLWQRRPFVDV